MDRTESRQIRLKAAFCVIAAALAFWAVHGLLRFVLLFRDNPYGIPFVAKPDWYIFHALCIDYIWIAEMAVPFLLLAMFLPVSSRVRRYVLPVFCVLQAIILPFTLLDHEIQRFLGTHFSISLLNTYKDASSLSILPDYVSSDQSIPYLQWVLLVGIVPLAFFLYRLIRAGFMRCNVRVSLLRAWLIGCVAFFGFSELFLNVIWKGTNRMRKLQPVVEIVVKDLREIVSGGAKVDPQFIAAATQASRRLWAQVEGPDAELYEYPSDDFPMYRVPKAVVSVADSSSEAPADSANVMPADSSVASVADSSLETPAASGSETPARPNFIVIFMESERGMDVGYLNPDDSRPSATPVLDSLAKSGWAWTRFYAAGVPTVGGVLSSHFGFPPHRYKLTASELVYADIPSFASILRDNGYSAQFFSAADPAWDNLSVWFQKWYDRTHYDRAFEDDSTFFDKTAGFIRDTLAPSAARDGKPFLAAMITRSNHYPFNLVPGMPDSAKALPQADRMRYTMHWADAQMGRFLGALSGEEWFKNTFVIVLGDHGFPQGEHGVSAIGSEAYSNVTWIPFVVNGPAAAIRENPGLLHDGAAGQCDIAPTVLALAGIRAANSFMGHNLMRRGGKPFAAGVHSGKSAMAFDSLRILGNTYDNSATGLYDYRTDVREDHDLGTAGEGSDSRLVAVKDSLKALADTVLGLNDWIMVENRVQRR